MMRLAALPGFVAAVWVFWQPLSTWVQSLLCMTFALLCWRAGGEGEKHG